MNVLFLVWLIAFGLNGVWECVHGPLLYDTRRFGGPAGLFPWILLWATLVDASLVMLFFVIGAWWWGSMEYFLSGGVDRALFLLVIGFLFAVWIEYKALFLFDQWSYNERMPVVFSLGLSPLVQLSATALLVYLFV